MPFAIRCSTESAEAQRLRDKMTYEKVHMAPNGMEDTLRLGDLLERCRRGPAGLFRPRLEL